jgi:hypothetical protein
MGAKVWPYQRQLLSGAARGLLVSPWFATGAGFVIAAGAFMYAPHAELNFGNEVIGRAPCRVAGCTIPQQAPVMAGGANGLVTPSPSASSTGRHAAHAGSDSPTFAYSVKATGSDAFQMTLTVTSEHAVGPWKLAFVIPGAGNLSVVGASWQASGTDGGSASGGAHSAPSSQPTSGTSANQPDIVSFVVYGKGESTAAPGHLVFSDAQGTFSLS